MPDEPIASPFTAAMTLQAAMMRGVTDAFDRWHRTATAMTTAMVPGPARERQAPAEKLRGTPDDVVVGTEATYTRRVTLEEIRGFADVCGDVNPLHFDDEYARKNTHFDGVIAHGLLTASFISSALSRLPGVVIYLEQNLRFLGPVRPGDEVTAKVEVTERPEGKKWMRLRTTCALADGTVVLDGDAKILLRPEKRL